MKLTKKQLEQLAKPKRGSGADSTERDESIALDLINGMTYLAVAEKHQCSISTVINARRRVLKRAGF